MFGVSSISDLRICWRGAVVFRVGLTWAHLMCVLEGAKGGMSNIIAASPFEE